MWIVNLPLSALIYMHEATMFYEAKVAVLRTSVRHVRLSEACQNNKKIKAKNRSPPSHDM